MTGARTLHGAALAEALRDARRRSWALLEDLSDAQWQVPHQPGVNPPAWELGHVGWFGEFWTLRGPHRVGDDGFVHATLPARHAGPDETFDSARLPHEARWRVPLPDRAALRERLAGQLAACLAALPSGQDDEALYFHRLTLFHEDMHGEAFTWLRSTLAYPAPPGCELRRVEARAAVAVPGGTRRLGWPADAPGFAFDNERPGREVAIAPFEIDAQPVSAGDFLRFVEAGGYENPAFWPGDAGRWRASIARTHPERWRRRGSPWEQRWFDRWQPLDPAQPVIHVNAWEAEAYARWAGRRLPSAAEWEHAALTAPGFDWGRSVWEWTADAFVPHDGFQPGPYKDYSAPWFGDHRELRGGAFATHERMHEPRYRNFFRPERSDVFAGFRTVSL